MSSNAGTTVHTTAIWGNDTNKKHNSRYDLLRAFCENGGSEHARAVLSLDSPEGVATNNPDELTQYQVDDCLLIALAHCNYEIADYLIDEVYASPATKAM